MDGTRELGGDERRGFEAGDVPEADVGCASGGGLLDVEERVEGVEAEIVEVEPGGLATTGGVGPDFHEGEWDAATADSGVEDVGVGEGETTSGEGFFRPSGADDVGDAGRED